MSSGRAERQRQRSLGLGLADLTPDVRQQIEAPEGVHAGHPERRSGSPADDAGLQRGDIIVSVNRKRRPPRLT